MHDPYGGRELDTEAYRRIDELRDQLRKANDNAVQFMHERDVARGLLRDEVRRNASLVGENERLRKALKSLGFNIVDEAEAEVRNG